MQPPTHTARRDLLVHTASTIADYRDGVAGRPVAAPIDPARIGLALGPFPEHGSPAHDVIAQLIEAVEPGLVDSTGPRYFGFVVGGSLDAAVAADMLASGWDQNCFTTVMSPAMAMVEEVAGDWLKTLLGLPASASFGFVTGAQAANTVGLLAARHHVLARIGWDVERDGLMGAPQLRVVLGAERHATIDRSLRLVGLGTGCVATVPTDEQGAIDVGALSRLFTAGPDRPTIVCLQAGNVNTGAFDDFVTAIEICRKHDAWVHIDGAFGLWAAASATHRHLVRGADGADSWCVDGHKWLNVPYDCGYAFCAHPEVHAAALSYTAAYLAGQGENTRRAPGDFVLESSRRARALATWAALKELGRDGVEELVERCCRLAVLFAEQLAELPGVEIANDVVLNQVLVGFGDDAATERVVAAVQRSGECWMGSTTWHGRRLMRISVSNWQTTADDVARSVAAIAAALGSSRDLRRQATQP